MTRLGQLYRAWHDLARQAFIAELRVQRAAGRTLEDLAQEIGSTRQQVWRWCNETDG